MEPASIFWNKASRSSKLRFFFRNKLMELISPRPSDGVQELKQEVFLRAEELERLVAIYNFKLRSNEMASLKNGSNLIEESKASIAGDQRGQFYDFYMMKREEKLKEEWRTREAEKKAGMMAMMESLAATSSTIMNRAMESKNNHSWRTNSRNHSTSSTIPPISRGPTTTTHNPAIRSSNLTSMRKENTKPSTETTLQRSIARSKSSSEKMMSLAMDIKARRSQSLQKNSASFGEPKDFSSLNSDSDTFAPPMHSNPRGGALKPLLRKRISMAAQALPDESTEMKIKGNEQFDSMMIEDNQKKGFSEQSWSSFHRFESSNQIAESPKSRNFHQQSILSEVHEAARERKKWGSVERPFIAVDTAKGLKRFMKFGKRSTELVQGK